MPNDEQEIAERITSLASELSDAMGMASRRGMRVDLLVGWLSFFPGWCESGNRIVNDAVVPFRARVFNDEQLLSFNPDEGWDEWDDIESEENDE